MASRNVNNNSIFKSVDFFTIGIYLLFVILGAFSIYAASYDFDNAGIFDFSEFSGKQFMWIGISACVAVAILLIDSRIYEAYAYPIYAAILLLLIVTIFIAPDIKGSRSWLVLGPVSIQPAEFAKFATSLALARLFNSYNFRLYNIKNYLISITIILLPALLIIAQHETGSALVYFSLFIVLYREGMSGMVILSAFISALYFVLAIKFSETSVLGIETGQFIVFCIIIVVMISMLLFYCKSFVLARNTALFNIGAALVATILTYFGVTIPGYYYFAAVISISILYILFNLFKEKIKRVLITVCTALLSIVLLFSVDILFNHLGPHQQMRIKVNLGMVEDLRDAGYNVNQSKIAIGSGGFTGKGFLKGTQTKLKFVPEQHTDFIFCTIGEEKGFVGSAIVLILFLILIYRIIFLSERQTSSFGRIYGYCVASILIFHVTINVGMVIGLCPVIGIPLPLFSYGGSSLLGFTILLFILLRIDASRRERINYN
ncbi:MAG: rod shape-determining protein RodA [Muribaculaceae bacterium]|nr:rod shape-determining protein RodA [Muribaculaceae bacterium]